MTGTYSIVLDPRYGATYTAKLAVDLATPITIDGSMPTLTTTYDGDALIYSFSGTAGNRLEVGVSGLTYSSASSSLTNVVTVQPDGAVTYSGSCATSSGCEIGYSQAMSATGTWSIVVTPPPGISIAGGTLGVSSRVSGMLSIGGGSQSVTIGRPGQTAAYSFAGTSGQLLRLNWSGTAVSPTSESVTATLWSPSGSQITYATIAHGATGGFDLPSLPSTGTYTITFDPASAATSTLPVSLVTR